MFGAAMHMFLLPIYETFVDWKIVLLQIDFWRIS